MLRLLCAFTAIIAVSGPTIAAPVSVDRDSDSQWEGSVATVVGLDGEAAVHSFLTQGSNDHAAAFQVWLRSDPVFLYLGLVTDGGSGGFPVGPNGVNNEAVIELAVPRTHYTVDPLGVGLPLVSTDEASRLALGRSFGIAVLGQEDDLGQNEAGIVSSPIVKQATAAGVFALFGAGLLIGAGRRRHYRR
jgi:hypothetical protein